MLDRNPVGAGEFAEFGQNLRFLGREAFLVEIGNLMTGQYNLLRQILQRSHLRRFQLQLSLQRIQFLAARFRRADQR